MREGYAGKQEDLERLPIASVGKLRKRSNKPCCAETHNSSLFPVLDASLNNLLLLGQSVTWHKPKHRPAGNRECFRVLRPMRRTVGVWIGPPSLIHMG